MKEPWNITIEPETIEQAERRRSHEKDWHTIVLSPGTTLEKETGRLYAAFRTAGFNPDRQRPKGVWQREDAPRPSMFSTLSEKGSLVMVHVDQHEAASIRDSGYTVNRGAYSKNAPG